jgi:GntR family transcriptional regulator
LNLIISNAAGQPIYEQIYTQLKQLILSGELHEGDALPSMRVLAKELRISVITTKRAYEELERDGFLVTVAGKGCFVAEKNLDLIREQQLKELENHLTAAAGLAKSCSVTVEELIDMLRVLLEEENV